MRRAVIAWLAALLTALLWIVPLARVKAPAPVEVAFYYGALLLPPLGALIALSAALDGPPRAPAIACIAVNLLLLVAYLLLVGAPVS